MTTQETSSKEITETFAGKWKEARSENVEAFYREMGLNFFIRKLALQLSIEMDIAVSGEDIEVNMRTPMRSETYKYKLNEEVELVRDDGKFTVETTYENGKLTSKQSPVPGNDSQTLITTREVTPQGELVSTQLLGGVTCKRFFTKLQ